MRRRAALAVLAIVLIAIGVLAADRGPVLAWALPRALSLATGAQVTIGRIAIGSDRAILQDVDARKNGASLAHVARVQIDYSLRDLLPGSRHRYGLHAIELDRPVFTLIRTNGAYNLPLPSSTAPHAPAAPHWPNRVPIAFTVRVRDGAIALREPRALDPQARAIDVRDLNLDATIDGAARTHYRLTGAFAGAVRQPFTLAGTIDETRGYAMHHVTAAAIPLRALTDFFVNTPAAQVLAGTATGIDARLYALDVQPHEPIDYHVSGRVAIDGLNMRLVGLAQPVTGLHGEVQMVDDQIFWNRIDGEAAGIPLRITGGVFDFAQPQFHIAVAAHAQLANLRKLFAFAANQPLAGDARIAVRVEGSVDAPAILASVDVRNASYRGIPFDRVRADVAYRNSTVLFMPLEAQAHGADLRVRGALELGQQLHSRLALRVDAPADALPYAGELLGAEPLAADFTLDGLDTNFAGYGALQSTRGIARTAAVVELGRGGLLAIAPLWVDTERGSAAGAYYLNRADDTSAFWVHAHDFTMRPPQRSSSLAASLPKMPPIHGTIDDVDVEGGGPSGYHALMAGVFHAAGLTIGGVGIDALDARFAGLLADAAIDPLHARGPWGSMDGSGALSLDSFAVRGIYHGTLEGLRAFLSGTPASGRIDGTAAVALSPRGIVVQADDLVLRDASVRGIPISHARGTLTIAGNALDIASARAQVAGGTIVAAGNYDRGISLVATNLNGARLRALGLPLARGSIDADGTVRSGAPLPAFSGGVALANGAVQNFSVAGSALLALHANGARLEHVVGGIDGIYAMANGDLGALTSGAPQYAVTAHVPAGSLGRAIGAIGIGGPPAEGTFDTTLAVSGAGLNPHVRGPIGVPSGSINGLYFTGAAGLLGADRGGVILNHGAVDVHGTHLLFAAAENPHVSGLRVRAAHTNLADFDDFFDMGDALQGTGSMRFDVISQGHRLSSNGAIAIEGFGYRNLPIGNTSAVWSSQHNLVRGSLDIGGAGGSLYSHGSIAVVPHAALLDTLRDSSYALTARVKSVDLSTWIAASGYPQVPVTGRFDANVNVNGRFPHLTMNGSADLQPGGTIWRLPIDRAAIAFSSKGERLQLDSATLLAPGLTVSASGNFGVGLTSPVAMTLRASSNDVPQLVATLWHKQVPVSGAYETTVTLGGTFFRPSLQAAFLAQNAVLYGLNVPSLFGSFELHGRNVVLRDAGAKLLKGSVAIAGTVPLQLVPFGIARNAPVSFSFTASGVDPSDFDTIIGNDTKLGGTIDGDLGVSGTLAKPHVSGRFSVKNGSYASNFELTPITAIDADLNFTQTAASLEQFKARFGSGTVSGTGRVAIDKGTTFAAHVTARGAQLNLPTYGSGTFDADLVLERTIAQKTPDLRGTVTLQSATIPFAAFLAATAKSAGNGAAPLPLDLDMQLNAGKNVRVRGSGYGAGLDLGATGGVHLAGSLANPTLEGSFTAKNGTLTYYDRAFRVQEAKVVFHAADGLIPTIHATASTHVTNPDPNSPFSTVDVTATVTGPVTNPKIAFTSNPPGYTNDQILALIAPFGGVILTGVSYAPNQPGRAGVPNNALSPVPGAQPIGGTSNSITAGQEAFNIVNAQFAAGLLSPVEGALSQGLGLQNVNLTLNYYGNVGFSASRFLGKTVNFLYATTFGLPTTTSFGLQLIGERTSTSAQLSFYFTNGAQRLFETPVANASLSDSRLSVGEPLQGQSGFAFTLQRLFW
ncbi:MAG TPA: translocation/assembly module TamB domain-containing protein [Candidatus Baltobacteraceae bacterium]|nr:translocation/assembly module TamB domain-containing protein [Candidatus Baltobacteraceae bacterium]